MPTWTIEESFGDRMARERIGKELNKFGVFREVPGVDAMAPEFVALQARYLRGVKREGRKIPRNQPTN